MTKGGLFSKTLYREGLRQTRALGFVFLGIVLGSLLMMFVMQVGAALTTPPASRTASIIDLYEGVPMLLLSFVWAPIMILVLFHFIDKRNQCDFYHALPHTRPQLAFSFLAAILTWTLGGMLVAFGLYAILYSIVPNSIVMINWAGSLHSLASFIAMLILVTGGAFLATSLTGTVSSGILGTGLILLMPRVLIGIVTSQAVNAMPILMVDDLPFPLGSYNLVANFFSKFFETFHAPIGAILYTFLLGVLYLVLGLWAFTRRKSEKAGSAAISNGAQTVFRVLAASPILLGAAIMLIEVFRSDLSQNNEYRSALIFGAISSAVTLLCISLGVFVLYELFTTRSGRRLLKILPTYGFVVLIAAAGALVICTGKSVIAASVPKADEIESVALLPTKQYDGLFADLFGYQPSYFDAVTKDVYDSDPAVAETVANALKQNVKAYNEDGYLNVTDSTNMTRVAIRLKNGGEQVRTVSLSNDQLNLLKQSRLTLASYIDAVTNLPDETRTPVIVRSENGTITEAQARQVYAQLRQELAEMDKYVRSGFINATSYMTESNICSLYMQSVVGSDVYGASLPLSQQFPKALEMYLNFGRENANFEKWVAKNPITLSGDEDDFHCELNFSSARSGSSFYAETDWLQDDNGHVSDENLKVWNTTVEWIKQQSKKPIDINGEFGLVYIDRWDFGGHYDSVSLYIPMDGMPDEVNQLYKITQKEQDGEEDRGDPEKPLTASVPDMDDDSFLEEDLFEDTSDEASGEVTSQAPASGEEAASSQGATSSQTPVSSGEPVSVLELPAMPL